MVLPLVMVRALVAFGMLVMLVTLIADAMKTALIDYMESGGM